MASDDILDTFTSTSETLEDVGVEDDFFRELVASRLTVERVGESNNLDWWESRVLSETGRARLSEVTPKTQLKSRINLAMRVGRKAESDRVPENTASLFYLGPQLESRLEAAIEDIETNELPALEELEAFSIQAVNEAWTDPIVSAFDSDISDAPTSEFHMEPESRGAFSILSDSYAQDEIERRKWKLLTSLLHGYGRSTDQLQVPYFTIEPNLKSENAG